MKLKIYLRILLVLLINLTEKSSLTAQEYKEKQWKPIVNGDFEFRFFNEQSDQITMFILKKNGTVPAIVDSKIQTSPIIIFNKNTSKLVNLKTNYVGDPMVMYLKQQMLKVSDSVYLLQSNNRIVRAQIKSDSVIYTETFQLDGVNQIVYSTIGKNNIYYCKFVNTGNCIYICDLMGNLIKKVPIVGSYLDIKSLAEHKGKLFVSYDPDGLNYDGIGVSSVNLNTGEITRLGSEEIYNLNGSMIKSISGRLFLTTDAYKYPQDLLYERIDTNWIPISGINDPYEKDGKLYVQFFKGQVYMPTNDTIIADEAGYRELPKDLSLGLGQFLDPTNHSFDPFDPDPRTKILFDQDFINGFYAKNGYDPLVNYVFEYVNGPDTIVYGVGDGIIASLGVKTDEIKTSTVNLPRFTIYPNPANTNITIQNLVKDKEYVINNIVGQNVLSGYTLENQIDISNLVSGIYFLTIDGYKPEKLQIK